MTEEDEAKPTNEPVQAEGHRKHQQARLLKLRDKEARVRVSVRLDTTVDEKLDQLAKLRGLDRNTAISVAIVQDWLACVEPNHPKRSDT